MDEMQQTPFDPKALCPPLSERDSEAARRRQARLLKPPGSLGRLEEITVWLAGTMATDAPEARHASVIVFAADHGVTAQGVSPYPSAVTTMMLEQLAGGRSAIAMLALTQGMKLEVVDVGVDTDLSVEGVLCDKLRRGTRDFSIEAAMTWAEYDHAMAAGARAVARTHNPYEVQLRIFGEMGIGNTSAAAAVLCGLTGADPAEAAGPGTGLDRAGVSHKARVIGNALALHGLSGQAPANAERVMMCVGGYEIAAMAGGMIASAQERTPVLVDGYIATVAALFAVRINPSLRPYLMFAHRSAEPGHTHALEALDARALLDLDMRLGEGSGAAVAIGIIRQACMLYHGMTTFEEAGISGPETAP